MYDSTLVVGLIWIMIFLVWFLSNTSWYYKSNVLEYASLTHDNVVVIDGKQYKLIFQELVWAQLK